jgi:nucleoside-diphosphate-sugar epimerase
MRVFVTGATGFIGSAIVQELINAGHQVLGLARNDASANALARLRVEAHRGDLSDTESLAAGARACEGVIHMAFIHDFSDYPGSSETDRRAVAALAGALERSSKPLVIASGTLMVSHARPATEQDAPLSIDVPRAASEAMVLAASGRGVRGSVVRLPPSVHGDGDHGFVPQLIAIAREKGVSAYVGDGLNRWPAVHRLDAARLCRLAFEKGIAGSRFHAVADEGVPVRDIADVIGRRLNVPVVAKSTAEAADHFGFLGWVLGIDGPATSALTQERLGWRPTQPGLISDIDHVRYFDAVI